MTDDDWFESLAVNLTGSMYMIRELVPGMKARGWGRIVNVTSVPEHTDDMAGFSAYTAAKGGVVGLALTLAVELERFGIGVTRWLLPRSPTCCASFPPRAPRSDDRGRPADGRGVRPRYPTLGLVVDAAPNGQVVHVGGSDV